MNKKYISRNSGLVTRIAVLGGIDKKTGIAYDVRIIENGILIEKKGNLVKEFQLFYGILKFVEEDKEVLLNGK